MKKLIVFVLAVVLLIGWQRAMRARESEIRKAAYDYVREVCGSNTECHMRIDAEFRHCFALAYSGGLLPSQASVSLNDFAGCFNVTDLNTRLEVIRGSNGRKPPFPTR